MSLRSQSDRLARQAAAQRAEVYGQTVHWLGNSYAVAVTGVKQSRDLEAGPLDPEPACILRIPTTVYPAFVPALGDTIRVGDIDLLVNEVTPLPLAAEIRVALGRA